MPHLCKLRGNAVEAFKALLKYVRGEKRGPDIVSVEVRKRKGVALLAEVWKSDQEIIGENIKKARKAAKLTQEQLAEDMGGSCSNKVISRYEKGEVEMGVQTLIDIAENLEVPVDSLMPERVQVHTEPEDDEMSRLFSGLNTENREMLLKMARMMAQNEALKMAI